MTGEVSERALPDGIGRIALVLDTPMLIRVEAGADREEAVRAAENLLGIELTAADWTLQQDGSSAAGLCALRPMAKVLWELLGVPQVCVCGQPFMRDTTRLMKHRASGQLQVQCTHCESVLSFRLGRAE